jgi:hypothetical protein
MFLNSLRTLRRHVLLAAQNSTNMAEQLCPIAVDKLWRWEKVQEHKSIVANGVVKLLLAVHGGLQPGDDVQGVDPALFDDKFTLRAREPSEQDRRLRLVANGATELRDL